MAKLKSTKKWLKTVASYTGAVATGMWSFEAFATQSLGNVASQITSSFEQVTKLITAGSYIAGLAFAIGAIMKFKQHKDNPTQIPIGTPIALLFIAAALLFLPSVLGVAGETMFSSDAAVSGPGGSIFNVQ